MACKDSIEILYEDNHIIVVVKPRNMPTQGDRTGDADLLEALKKDIKVRYNKPGNVFLGLVHRLDRPVGGVMVFAKTSKAASRISEQIRTRSFDKTYMAVVYGVPEQLSGTLEHYLFKDEKTNVVNVVTPAGSAIPGGSPATNYPFGSADSTVFADVSDSIGQAGQIGRNGKTVEGKLAVLDYNVKDSKAGLSLVYIRLHTGRPHQIRVQFAAIGHPLYGDQKYGASVNKPGMQLALWSSGVGFSHPTLKQQMTYTSKPPDAYPWNLFDIA